MNPGRELDALIAEKVMGYFKLVDDCNTYWVDADGDEPMHSHDYSTDIASAWLVVKRFTGFEECAAFIPEVLKATSRRIGSQLSDSYLILHLEPVDICLAALEAIKWNQARS